MSVDLAAFIRSLPKTETHLHIEGALPWALLQAKFPEKYAEVPKSWSDNFKFHDFSHFENELLSYAADWFSSADDYYQAAKVVFAGHVERNVKYVETSFASGCCEFFGPDAKESLDAILAAVPEGLEVRVFFGLHHAAYSEKMGPVLEEALTWDHLTGVDLHGHEDDPTLDWVPDYWKRAREAGKYCKAHAGEFLGASFVRYAIEELKAQRIQHGVRAIEDPDVVQMLVDNGIALDVCPISNVKLAVTENFKTHPLRQLTEAGVMCTISSDDPISFGNNLEDDYTALVERGGYSLSEIVEYAKNGFKVALMEDTVKQKYIEELDAIKASLDK